MSLALDIKFSKILIPYRRLFTHICIWETWYLIFFNFLIVNPTASWWQQRFNPANLRQAATEGMVEGVVQTNPPCSGEAVWEITETTSLLQVYLLLWVAEDASLPTVSSELRYPWVVGTCRPHNNNNSNITLDRTSGRPLHHRAIGRWR